MELSGLLIRQLLHTVHPVLLDLRRHLIRHRGCRGPLAPGIGEYMTELIILGLFLGIGKHLIGLIDLLELFFCRLGIIPVEVRMVFTGQLFKGFLYICLGSAFIYPKHFIVIAFFAHVAPPNSKA